jgi:hypothetical protein
MGKLKILATVSLMISSISFTSLVWRIYTTQNTSTYSWIYLSGILLAQSLMITYGLANNAPELYLPTIYGVVGMLYIMYNKYTYGHKYDTQHDIQE